MRAYNLLCLFLGQRGILIAVEWVVKHYWLGDELLQQEYLILVLFFFVSNHAPQYFGIVSSP
jgi:hypothetical protein